MQADNKTKTFLKMELGIKQQKYEKYKSIFSFFIYIESKHTYIVR